MISITDGEMKHYTLNVNLRNDINNRWENETLHFKRKFKK